MNRFVHRIVSARTRSAIPKEILYQEIARKKVVWFGEIHSEDRIVAFQNDLLKSMTADGCESGKLHVILEHFSMDMQCLLDTFQSNPKFSFDQLKQAYKDIGTEGHNLDPYRGLLMFCKQSKMPGFQFKEEIDFNSIPDSVFQDGKSANCEIHVYGGFMPRPLAGRLNKAESMEEKRALFEELYEKDFLPPRSSPAHNALFLDPDRFLLKGSQPHFRLIQSLMSGQDLYDPTDQEPELKDMADLSTPISRLYQAQVLKDHAMGYFLSKLMTKNHQDRFLVIAGMGHCKHFLGVPECLEGYLLQAQSSCDLDPVQKKAAILIQKETSARAAMIGCQMLYETYLEERYHPLQAAIETAENDEKRGGLEKQKAMNNLYLRQRQLFDRLILESEVIQGPLFNQSTGIGRFKKPSFDYCFVYDEDDDCVVSSNVCPESSDKEQAKAI